MDPMNWMRSRAKTEEVDYMFVMGCLSSYKKPRDKLTSLMKKEELIRVKKGLYVFGKEYRRRPYSLEVLANLIYGPSYVSFEFALSYYGMIPERVVRVTSACSKRNKLFETQVGTFVYHYVAPEKFPTGITWASIDEQTHFLIATREKALADTLARMKPFADAEDLYVYLVEGMRIDEDDLDQLQTKLLEEIALHYNNKNVTLLCQSLKR